MKISLVPAALLMVAMTTGAEAAVIDFTVDASRTLSDGAYTQNGFTIAHVSNGGAAARLLNNNYVFGDVLANGGTTTTSVSLARTDGGLFSLNGFLGGSGYPDPVTVTYDLAGFLASANTYNQTLTGTKARGNTFAAATFTLKPTPATNLFDRVTFTFKSSLGSSILDDIDVTAFTVPTRDPDPVPVPNPDPVPPATAAVPEPATWAMMLLGFGVMGGTMRRRRTTLRYA